MILKRAVLVLLFLLGACGERDDKPGEILHVAPYTSACIGAGPMNCMQVRADDESNYQLFYNHIEGFDFEPGYNYTLRVKVENVDNPPADGSSLRYTLLEVVSKEPVNQ
ncbi:MAG: DUF4377 domain-containing protein [Pseudomonadales bacterium]|nr:DUF4377 domain-containing protein [Pseudomonadales bacterium]